MAVASAGFFEPGADGLSLEDLCRHPLLLMRRSVGVGSYERLMRAMSDAGLKPHVALYSSDPSLMLDMLDEGFPGIAVIPESETGAVRGRYAVLPVEADLPDYQVSLVCRKADYDAQLIGVLLSSWEI